MADLDKGFWTNPANLRVEGGWLTDGNNQMKSACHHKRGDAMGDCGGCAARMDRVTGGGPCLRTQRVMVTRNQVEADWLLEHGRNRHHKHRVTP